MPKVWLITGSGNGLGRSIAEIALAAGNQVIATARDVHQLDDLLIQYGSNVRAVELDVTNESQGKAAIDAAIQTFGKLDVLVNNAGYGDCAPFEQVPADEFRRLIETNFFGVANLTRAALPVMRQQRSGHIIHISSIGGRFATPGNAAYHASKWAVGGFTEALAAEIAPFGVKMTALEPGGMRTNWGERAFTNRPSILPDYEASVGETIRQLESYWGNEEGDPARVAQVVLKVAEADRLPSHIVLGSAALQFVSRVEHARADDADRWRAVSASIDINAADPVPGLPTI
jgi:NAD(P)-dependent dehydrogenase (short-subunit alcohol dehydrogenase family)